MHVESLPDFVGSGSSGPSFFASDYEIDRNTGSEWVSATIKSLVLAGSDCARPWPLWRHVEDGRVGCGDCIIYVPPCLHFRTCARLEGLTCSHAQLAKTRSAAWREGFDGLAGPRLQKDLREGGYTWAIRELWFVHTTTSPKTMMGPTTREIV